MNKQYTRVGTVTVPDPAAAVTVTLGFKPSWVRAFSEDNLASYEHFNGMDDGKSLDVANHADTQISINAADGITLTADGFTLGTDICDTADDTVRWVAVR